MAKGAKTRGAKGAKTRMTNLERVAHSALRQRVNLTPVEHKVYDRLREKHLAETAQQQGLAGIETMVKNW